MDVFLRTVCIVSLQISILKVLAGLPDGKAAIPELNRILAVLASAGPDWADRIRRMAARAPHLDIFSEGLVVRDRDGWQITPAGRLRLHSLEARETPLKLVDTRSRPSGGGDVAVVSDDTPADRRVMASSG